MAFFIAFIGLNYSATIWLIGLMILGKPLHIISRFRANFHGSRSFQLTAIWAATATKINNNQAWAQKGSRVRIQKMPTNNLVRYKFAHLSDVFKSYNYLYLKYIVCACIFVCSFSTSIHIYITQISNTFTREYCYFIIWPMWLRSDPGGNNHVQQEVVKTLHMWWLTLL